MEIHKGKGRVTYRERIWINRKRVNSPYFERKSDARKWLADQKSKKYELELHGDSLKLKEQKTFKDFAEDWIISKEAGGLALGTLGNYKASLKNHIYPAFAEKDLKHIKKSEIEKLQNDLRKTHNGKGTNSIMVVIKSILKDAHRDGYLVKNPAEYIPKLKENPPHEVYWTKAEIDQFLRGNFQNPLFPFFLIAVNTGMRRGELCGLCWDRVDFSLNQITITRTRDREEFKETTKTNLKRIVPMNQMVKTTLLTLFKNRSESNFVFTKQNGEPIGVQHVYRDFMNGQKKAGLQRRIRFHDLRHTFASQFIMNGGNVFDLQKILGHTDIKMTMRYAHYSTEHLQNAMNKFELGMISDESTLNRPQNKNFVQKVVNY